MLVCQKQGETWVARKRAFNPPLSFQIRRAQKQNATAILVLSEKDQQKIRDGLHLVIPTQDYGYNEEFCLSDQEKVLRHYLELLLAGELGSSLKFEFLNVPKNVPQRTVGVIGRNLKGKLLAIIPYELPSDDMVRLFYDENCLRV